MMIGFQTKVKKAFEAAKNDVRKTRQNLSRAIFSLSNEFAKMALRIEQLEQKIAELEGKKSRERTLETLRQYVKV